MIKKGNKEGRVTFHMSTPSEGERQIQDPHCCKVTHVRMLLDQDNKGLEPKGMGDSKAHML